MSDDRFFEALRGLQRQVRRFDAPDEEVLQEFRRVTESLALADASPTAEERGLDYYVYPSWRTTDLLSWWPLAQFERARDIKGSYDGALNGDVAFASEDDLAIGRRRYYATFDGSGDYVNVGDITELDAATNLTFACRFKVTSVATQRTLISRWAVGNEQYEIAVDTSQRILLSIDGGIRGYTSGVVVAGTWHSLVVVFNGAGGSNAERQQIYLDGAAKTLTFANPVPASIPAAAGDVHIGQRSDGTYSWLGEIYDAAIWSASLTAQEAEDHHDDDDSDRIVANEFKAG